MTARALLPLLAGSVLVLFGCAPKPSAEPVLAESPAVETANPTEDQCGASKLSEYLNAVPTKDVMDNIKAIVGHDRIRVIEPGSAVTMDYRVDRLNLDIGEDGRIKRFHCV
ncbi:MAG: I78 family peptidase inhibitor [Novosphingobium sp.]|nr:I78 family peptidase inhibitor [Novosphingobium sp.]